jgi:hypothetical protein
LGGCADGLAASGSADLAVGIVLTTPRAYRPLPRWAFAGPADPGPIDARLYPDLIWMLRRYGLRVTAARQAGHRTHGDGTAVDLVPAAANAHPTGTPPQARWPAISAGPAVAQQPAAALSARSCRRSSSSATTATAATAHRAPAPAHAPPTCTSPGHRPATAPANSQRPAAKSWPSLHRRDRPPGQIPSTLRNHARPHAAAQPRHAPNRSHHRAPAALKSRAIRREVP